MADGNRDAIGLHAQLACVWEATARKPGNVHPFADFDDLTYLDFVIAAAAVAPVLAASRHQRVGRTVLEGVRATRRVVSTNANLGILLLLAPLTKAAAEPDLRAGLARVLDELDVEDARLVYEAIRLANPGGLDRAPQQDVRDRADAVLAGSDGAGRRPRRRRPPVRLRLPRGVRRRGAGGAGWNRTNRVDGGGDYLRPFASDGAASRHTDRPQARPGRGGGIEPAGAGGARRRMAANARRPAALADLDAWLRAEGHQRNPGTTADLIAACLFVLLHEGRITLPSHLPWLDSGRDLRE